ncbi:MAG TPA: VOC family protein [Solirubrobacteraceae bacterium]|nr:VOC family protein [Solirubrobacteraceae bacterium]
MGVTGLEHVLVLSDDIDATRDFYTDIIGLRAGRRPPLEFPGHWLYAGERRAACLHIADRLAYRTHAAGLGLGPGDASGVRPEPAAAAVDHIAFDADDHEEVERRITRGGLRSVRNQVPGGPRQLFVSDPNGVLVEINVKDASR